MDIRDIADLLADALESEPSVEMIENEHEGNDVKEEIVVEDDMGNNWIITIRKQ